VEKKLENKTGKKKSRENKLYKSSHSDKAEESKHKEIEMQKELEKNRRLSGNAVFQHQQ